MFHEIETKNNAITHPLNNSEDRVQTIYHLSFSACVIYFIMKVVKVSLKVLESKLIKLDQHCIFKDVRCSHIFVILCKQ